MNIFQIFISENIEPLPPALVATTEAAKRTYAGHSYTLYRGDELRAFIAEHFERDVVRAYDCLRPFAYKADLGRFCLLHERGGLYMDITTQPLLPLHVHEDVRAVLFRDLNLMLPYGWGVHNGFMYAQPKMAFLARAIEMIVAHCKERIYCQTPFSITGPGLLGRALAASGEDRGFIYGDRLPLTPLHPNKNFGFVLPGGDIVAWGKRTGNGGDMTPFGMVSANNYKTMWLARDVFNPF